MELVIEETCGCGAKISVPPIGGQWGTSWAQYILSKWRKEHKHVMPTDHIATCFKKANGVK